ncbi:MAG: CinA family nicotinamide mononucleotide deamidase-related protein [Muribaculaceae bacterium]|nr:CinA family nicotinamide mononucleotide deamidase-related protein [Muribaculaceae bacterium]
MKFSIIAVGDELLIGQVNDTNTGEIARRFGEIGWEVNDALVIADDADAITSAIDRAFRATDVVLMTGGLGPTKDDITKATLLRYFGGEMIYDETVLANIEKVFERRGLKMNELTHRQAEVPSSCEVIQNEVGTAPIMWFEKTGKVLVSMPGVPFEMRAALEKIAPKLEARFPNDLKIVRRTLLVTDITESALAQRLEAWETNLPKFAHLAYLPQPGLIRLRLDCHISEKETDDAARLFDEMRTLVGDNLLFDDDLPLEAILLDELKRRELTVATAESCTGGNIAHRITSIAGSSEAFVGGIVAYSNKVKISQLGVNANTLTEYGAVSIPVVEQMATGACRRLGADCAIATSGIAGPGGGTEEKPVGTVCIAVAINGQVTSETRRFPGNRERVIDRATSTAIISLIKELRKH